MKKKILSISLLTFSLLNASTNNKDLSNDIISFNFSNTNIEYDSNKYKTLKNSTNIYKFYSSIGNKNYLLEGEVNLKETKYKKNLTTINETKYFIKDKQDYDYILKYSQFYKDLKFSIGGHYISSDFELSNSMTDILSIGKINKFNSFEIAYGSDLYITFYNKQKNVKQISPYITYKNNFSKNIKNKIDLIYNYQSNLKDYNSFEILNTFYYKKLATSIGFNYGDSVNLIKDKGFTVYNTKDTLRKSYLFKLEYLFNEQLKLSTSFKKEILNEYNNLLKSSNNKIINTNFTYIF
jgi:hypothetical protein